jgi:hypothetical protein
MMLGVPQYDLHDFLAAVGFLAPAGVSLDKILVPAKSDFQLPPDVGFVQAESNLDNVPGVTDTIVYERRDPSALLDTAAWPTEYSDNGPILAKNVDANKAFNPAVAPVGEMNAPFVDGGKNTFARKRTDFETKAIAEAVEKRVSVDRVGDRYEVSLKEAVGPFPKRSVLVFKEKKARR